MELFSAFLAAVIVLMLIPGPGMAYSIANGVAYGKKGALFAALGIGAGSVFLNLATVATVLVAAGIDPRALGAVQLAGAFYLVYLGAMLLLRTPVPAAEGCVLAVPRKKIFWRGFVTNISNPKAIIFFLSFVPQFIPAGHPHPAFTHLCWACSFPALGSCATSYSELRGRSAMGQGAG
jgi:threonine/homoserine/homoserine lactone efflux protein